MLFGLVFRGVVFEFRFKSSEQRRWIWDIAFFLGSLTAALAQGVILGAIVQGIAVEGRAYAGGWLDWLTPFSVMTGVAVVIGYALLGATWLVWKCEGPMQDHFRGLALTLMFAMLAMIGIVSLWTPALDPATARLDRPSAQVLEAEDGAQQRRLAGPAGSENRDELAGLDVEVKSRPQFPLATAQRRPADAERRLGVRGRAGAHASSASASSAMFCCIHEM